MAGVVGQVEGLLSGFVSSVVMILLVYQPNYVRVARQKSIQGKQDMATVQISTKSDIKKAKFIELWRQTNGHISDCCRTLGMRRETFYSWLHKDQEFAKALIEAEGELNDDIRNALIDKAGSGDLGAIIFYLRKRHPDFLDRPNLTQVNVGEMNLEIVKDDQKTE